MRFSLESASRTAVSSSAVAFHCSKSGSVTRIVWLKPTSQNSFSKLSEQSKESSCSDNSLNNPIVRFLLMSDTIRHHNGWEAEFKCALNSSLASRFVNIGWPSEANA